jgi:hypothetical protein
VANCANGLPSPIVENESTDKLKIFPNPANQTFTAYAELVTIYDLLGNQVLNSFSKDKNHQIDVSALSIGIYLVKLQNNDNIVSQKLIIQR